MRRGGAAAGGTEVASSRHRGAAGRWPAPLEGVLVVGVGNVLRGDDGAGVAVAEACRARLEALGAKVLEVHQLLPELTLELAGARRVVIVDADLALSPGAVEVRPIGPPGAAALPSLQPGPLSHGIDPAELLAAASSWYAAEPEAVLVGLGVAALDPGGELSPPVRTALPGAVAAVLAAAALPAAALAPVGPACSGAAAAALSLQGGGASSRSAKAPARA